MSRRVIATTDVLGAVLEVPDGHRHLRTVLHLRDGSEIELQEATMAALARAFVRVKTDPVRDRMRLAGRDLPRARAGFARWQLLEEE